MSEHILKRHNKGLLLYHLVFPLKYRKSVTTEEMGEGLKRICLEISERYEVDFLVQSVPSYSVSKMIRMLKSITAKQLFQRFPEIKEKLWGGKFWTSGFYVNTVGQYSNEEVIRNMLKIKE